MHAVGIHSANAVRRERRRRAAEQQRTRDRHSADSPHHSTASLEHRPRFKKASEPEAFPYATWLHFGILFLVLGLICLVGGWLPIFLATIVYWKSIGPLSSWFNTPVCYGLLLTGLGSLFLLLYKYLTKNQEEELENYIQKQLSRSRSGYRLARDAETGGMHTKHTQRAAKANEPESTKEGHAEPQADRAHVIVNALDHNQSPMEQIVEEDVSGTVQHERRHRHGHHDEDNISVTMDHERRHRHHGHHVDEDSSGTVDQDRRHKHHVDDEISGALDHERKHRHVHHHVDGDISGSLDHDRRHRHGRHEVDENVSGTLERERRHRHGHRYHRDIYSATTVTTPVEPGLSPGSPETMELLHEGQYKIVTHM